MQVFLQNQPALSFAATAVLQHLLQVGLMPSAGLQRYRKLGWRLTSNTLFRAHMYFHISVTVICPCSASTFHRRSVTSISCCSTAQRRTFSRNRIVNVLANGVQNAILCLHVLPYFFDLSYSLPSQCSQQEVLRLRLLVPRTHLLQLLGCQCLLNGKL